MTVDAPTKVKNRMRRWGGPLNILGGVEDPPPPKTKISCKKCNLKKYSCKQLGRGKIPAIYRNI
jgi:hypothetical protein